ncbi:MAG: hypothetical protein HY744_19505 [Deltaproteobacteria bacterium]|nr:hypothetical protein [Deltaproteobacteria bacterium]
MWSPDLSALVVRSGSRRQLVAYGVPGNQASPPPAELAAQERFGARAYGRPPSLVSVRGSGLQVRRWPKPGEPLPAPSPISGVTAPRDAVAQLDALPACESGVWTFQRLLVAPGRPYVLGVSPERTVAFLVPEGKPSPLGCSSEAVVLEAIVVQKAERTVEGKRTPRLARCALDGKCQVAETDPFRIWPEQHERRIVAVPTKQGVVGLMSARAGTRWGVYLAQSLDGGRLYELPRVVGEGKTDRGQFEVGALVALPGRVLLLLSADVTGTTRRGWYVLASDDAGTNWGPP